MKISTTATRWDCEPGIENNRAAGEDSNAGGWPTGFGLQEVSRVPHITRSSLGWPPQLLENKRTCKIWICIAQSYVKNFIFLPPSR